ncbi:ComF family protein [Marivirga sp.]|uniref:ComF family protein n=1 Tax=Marivirga sp. TaxID=2018662 RepID=UPI0025D80217|nr:ComF family protein [Marivirga sp.]
MSDFLSLFFPNYCSVCNLTLSKSENLVCSHCLSNVNETNLHLDQPNQLHRRFFEIPNLKYAMSYAWFQKDTVIQHLLHQLKYEGNEAIGLLLGEIYGEELAQYYTDKWDMITCVPIHYKKERKRGYNQSYRIAEGMSLSLKAPFIPLLEKSVNRKSQTKKHRIQRFDNVESTFHQKNSQVNLKNKRILLVDDVLTTGATLQACSQPLQKAGAEISIATIASTRS